MGILSAIDNQSSKSLQCKGHKPLPSRNRKLLESPWTWLKEKSQADQSRTGVPSNLWCVEGKFYDLEPFMNTHPGGKEFLKLTQGQDITELFMTNHLDQQKTRKVLEKYYVSANIPFKPIFTFQEDGFYRTLQNRVFQYFKSKKISHKTSQKVYIFAYITIVLYLITTFYVCKKLNVISAILHGLVLHICYGLGHIFMHQGEYQNLRYLHDLTLNSSYHWFTTHCISHHPFANTAIDIELSALEPYENHIRFRPTNSIFIYFYMHIFRALISSLECLSKIVFILMRHEKFRFEYSLPFINFFFILHSSQYNFFISLKLFFIAHGIASYLLVMISFPVHRTTYAWSEGCKEQPFQDFGLYMLQSTNDFNMRTPFPLSLILFEGWNQHLMHHLFPTIDITKLYDLNDILLQTLQEFGVFQYHKDYSFYELLVNHLDLLYRSNGQIKYYPTCKNNKIDAKYD